MPYSPRCRRGTDVTANPKMKQSGTASLTMAFDALQSNAALPLCTEKLLSTAATVKRKTLVSDAKTDTKPVSLQLVLLSQLAPYIAKLPKVRASTRAITPLHSPVKLLTSASKPTSSFTGDKNVGERKMDTMTIALPTRDMTAMIQTPQRTSQLSKR